MRHNFLQVNFIGFHGFEPSLIEIHFLVLLKINIKDSV